MELLEDYDFELQYHPGKANVVADTLSRRSHAELAILMCQDWRMLGDLIEVEIDTEETESRALLFTMSAKPTLVRKVIEAQLGDDEVRFLLDDMLGEAGLEGWHVGSD